MILGDIFVLGGYVILLPKIVLDIRPIRNDAESWMVKVGDILNLDRHTLRQCCGSLLTLTNFASCASSTHSDLG